MIGLWFFECESKCLCFIHEWISCFSLETWPTRAMSQDSFSICYNPLSRHFGEFRLIEKIRFTLFEVECYLMRQFGRIHIWVRWFYNGYLFTRTASWYEKKRDISDASCLPIWDGFRRKYIHHTLYPEKKYRSRKSNNPSYKSFYRGMTHRFIEILSFVVGIEFIERLRMKSWLVSDIHGIIDDDYGKHKCHSKFIAPYRVFEPHRCRECYDECWVSRGHSTTSEHIGKTKMTFCCMNNSLYNNRYDKGWKWYSESIFPEESMNSFHGIILLRWWYILFDQKVLTWMLYLQDFSR